MWVYFTELDGEVKRVGEYEYKSDVPLSMEPKKDRMILYNMILTATLQVCSELQYLEWKTTDGITHILRKKEGNGQSTPS